LFLTVALDDTTRFKSLKRYGGLRRLMNLVDL